MKLPREAQVDVGADGYPLRRKPRRRMSVGARLDRVDYHRVGAQEPDALDGCAEQSLGLSGIRPPQRRRAQADDPLHARQRVADSHAFDQRGQRHPGGEREPRDRERAAWRGQLRIERQRESKAELPCHLDGGLRVAAIGPADGPRCPSQFARHHVDRLLQVDLHATAVRVVVLIAGCGIKDPERECGNLVRLRIAANRAVKVVAVGRELDEAALLHLARLRPREHRLAIRTAAANHPPDRHRHDRVHSRRLQEREDSGVGARVRVVDRDEDGLLGERRLAAARPIDLVERERVPAVRDEVLEEGHEVGGGGAVRLELRSLVYDVV